MNKDINFSASADIARRAGIISSRYRTKDGRFIITDKDLGRIQLVMTPEEFMTGIDVRKITEMEAKNLIAENGYQIGEEYVEEETPAEEVPVEETAAEEPAAEENPEDGEDNNENTEEG